jgi:hypothetical protein
MVLFTENGIYHSDSSAYISLSDNCRILGIIGTNAIAIYTDESLQIIDLNG